jgi:hypothetical protein
MIARTPLKIPNPRQISSAQIPTQIGAAALGIQTLGFSWALEIGLWDFQPLADGLKTLDSLRGSRYSERRMLIGSLTLPCRGEQ